MWIYVNSIRCSCVLRFKVFPNLTGLNDLRITESYFEDCILFFTLLTLTRICVPLIGHRTGALIVVDGLARRRELGEARRQRDVADFATGRVEA